MKKLLTKNELLNSLAAKDISYSLSEHSALYTVNDSEKNRGKIKGIHTKNLFLKNKKNNFFLFSCHENQIIDLKRLSKSLKLGSLSFAKEDKLYELMGVRPGSVTPFGLLNCNTVVKFYLDKKIYSSEEVNFHPLENTSTVTINVKDFINFLLDFRVDVSIFSFESYLLIE